MVSKAQITNIFTPMVHSESLCEYIGFNILKNSTIQFFFRPKFYMQVVCAKLNQQRIAHP